jgi:hypothetical protein
MCAGVCCNAPLRTRDFCNLVGTFGIHHPLVLKGLQPEGVAILDL